MNTRFLIFGGILVAFMFLLDFFLARCIRTCQFQIGEVVLNRLMILHWTIPVVMSLFVLFRFVFFPPQERLQFYSSLFSFNGVFMILYMPKLIIAVFFGLESLIRGIAFLLSKLFSTHISFLQNFHPISIIGLILGLLAFITIAYGVLWGRFHYKITPQTIYHSAFPKSLNGLKVVQISDLHLGSFIGHTRQIERMVELVNEQEPDIIFFSGDLVNNFAEEVKDFLPALRRLHAPSGKYAVMGNHDYGGYYNWKSKEDKEKNERAIRETYTRIGFQLLNNEHDLIENGRDSLAVIGVENWGKPPFPQYGDLKKAMEGLEDHKFKILLSHDPSHWPRKVKDQSDIHLTLSGHTHAMQMGIILDGWQWSPAKYNYRYWGGMYRAGNQLLYVNKGTGYIGFPGRIGVRPEITVFEFFNKK